MGNNDSQIAASLREDNKRLRDALASLQREIPGATAQQKPLMLALIETALAPRPIPIELMTIEELDITSRLRNCLRNRGMRTVGDIVTKSQCYFLRGQNFGHRSLNELISVLAGLGVSLKPWEEDDDA